MTVNVGLIGFGLAGAVFHAPLIAAEAALRLARVVTSRADAVAAAYPEAAVTADADAVFADPAIDLVVIATPNDSHAPLGMRALRAGKHVVIDKPLAPTAEQANALIALAREQGRMMTVFHNRRWDGDFLTVAGLLREERLGEVMLAELRWDRYRPQIKAGWREMPGEGGGILADLGPHLIDQAIHLFGRPDAIGGDILAQRGQARVDDYFELTLHYGTRRVILGTSTLVRDPRPRFALHGSQGSFVKYGIDPQEEMLRAGGRPGDAGYGADAPERYGRLTDSAGARPVATAPGDWPCFYRRVAVAVVDGGPPPVDPADALTGLLIIDAARRSAREGRLLPLA